jgi:hypothetical protein
MRKAGLSPSRYDQTIKVRIAAIIVPMLMAIGSAP